MIKIVSAGKRYSDIEAGDYLVSINGHPICDLIDFRYHSADDRLKLVLQRPDGRKYPVNYDCRQYGLLEIEPEADPVKQCRNKCIFCFIHQLPKGLRKPLYVKDEDYRLSFLHGNYITLTNLGEDDFARIIKMRLSPLYISVHTTDEKLRKFMLGRNDIPPLRPQIERLIAGGIQIHAQIVVCPGVNDGEHLARTINDLSRYYPGLASVAVVPVGLTKHRQNLPKLRKVTPKIAMEILSLCEALQKDFLKKFNSRFVFPADEFFLLTGHPIPSRSYYEDFPQIENGVGMIRQLYSSRKLPKMRLKRNVKGAVVTGTLAYNVIKKLFAEKLESVENFAINVVPVENILLGKSVTVSGLLGGRDIYRSLKKSGHLGDLIFLPPDCLNDDGLFLDNWTPLDLQRKLKIPVVMGCYSVYNTFMPVLRRFI